MRHGEAHLLSQDGRDDSRSLTLKGQRQVLGIADRLLTELLHQAVEPVSFCVANSRLLRSKQTAEILIKSIQHQQNIGSFSQLTDAPLAPNSDLTTCVAWLDKIYLESAKQFKLGQEPILILVSHLPFIEYFLRYLVFDDQRASTNFFQETGSCVVLTGEWPAAGEMTISSHLDPADNKFW